MSKSSLSVMSTKVLAVVAMATGAIVLESEVAFAKAVAVGLPLKGGTCLPALMHYATIQAAVDALKIVGGANTINVCPGTYPEQITIDQPQLTIKGVPDGTAALSLITIPPAGLLPNPASPGVVAQIAASSAAVGVKLINLTIDGTGGACDAGLRGAGIAFIGVGDVTYGITAGAIQQVVVRNQRGCFKADGSAATDGILSDNSFISITGSILHDIGENCIRQIGGNILITNNTVQLCGTGAAISLNGTTGATVSNNVLFNFNWGIRLDNTTDCTVTTNTVGPWGGTAIYVLNSVNTGVTSNKVKEAYFGIWVGGSSGSIVRQNSMQRTAKTGIADVDPLGNNLFTQNTINESQYGIYVIHNSPPPTGTVVPPALLDLVEANTFLNVWQTTTDVLTFP